MVKCDGCVLLPALDAVSGDRLRQMGEELERLRGERKVLADLLGEALDVVIATDSESADEQRMFDRLVAKGLAALKAIHESNLQSTGSTS